MKFFYLVLLFCFSPIVQVNATTPKSVTCTRTEYREEYIPGTKSNPGYVKSYEVDIVIPCTREIKADKIQFSKRALEKDPLDWFKDNKKTVGDVITTRIHEVLKTGVKVYVDKEKKLIATIKKVDLAKDTADARPEVFSPGNALDAKITELDLKNRKIKLSVKAAQIDEEKSLIAKFGEGATKSGATLKGIFEKAIGKKNKKAK